jgi:hypothetical protein
MWPSNPLAHVGTSKIRLASDDAKFLLILLKAITISSPLRIFAPDSAASFALGAALRFEGRG